MNVKGLLFTNLTDPAHFRGQGIAHRRHLARRDRPRDLRDRERLKSALLCVTASIDARKHSRAHGEASGFPAKEAGPEQRRPPRALFAEEGDVSWQAVRDAMRDAAQLFA